MSVNISSILEYTFTSYNKITKYNFVKKGFAINIIVLLFAVIDKYSKKNLT